MEYREGLFYTKDHEWLLGKNNGLMEIGITDFAQDSLGDIVYVELPEVGVHFDAGDAVCAVESVKAASDVYCPISGTVAEVNAELESSPELINNSAFDAWLFKLKPDAMDDVNDLMDQKIYKEFCEK